MDEHKPVEDAAAEDVALVVAARRHDMIAKISPLPLLPPLRVFYAVVLAEGRPTLSTIYPIFLWG